MPVPDNSKPFTWRERTWPSLMAFCREHALNHNAVRARLRKGIIDERLLMRRIPRSKLQEIS